MKARLTPTEVKSYIAAPAAVRNAFDKQTALLAQNLRHPSLRAKKYGDVWQTRINRDWRFYYMIEGDTFVIHSFKAANTLRLSSHPSGAHRAPVTCL